MDAAPRPEVQITLRVPGTWEHPGELVGQLPDGFQLSPEALTCPDGSQLEFVPMPPDDQFAEIFCSSCRQPLTQQERGSVENYAVNVGLIGPGGSLTAARNMMQAAGAIIQAGGAGVFIDNSAMAHGGSLWQEMTDDGGPDALSYAFVSLIGGPEELRTMGMHALGFPDLVLGRSGANAEADSETLVEIVRYVCSSEKPIAAGHVVAGPDGPRFQAVETDGDPRLTGGPAHNTFGWLRLKRFDEIAGSN